MNAQQKPTIVESTSVKNTTPSSDRARSTKLIVGSILLLAAMFAIGIVPQVLRNNQIDSTAAAKKAAVPEVSAVIPAPLPKFSAISLPGNIDAVDQTAIVARAGGYVQQWLVDIGDTVHAGQTLAVIATPDLDQEVAQATSQLTSIRADYMGMLANLSDLQAKLAETKSNYQRSLAALDQSLADLQQAKTNVAHARETVAEQQADLVQGQANLNLAKVTSQRYQSMLSDGAVDRESADESSAADQADEAKVEALQASVHASEAQVESAMAAVASAEANVRAYQSSVSTSREEILSAQANIRSGEAGEAAAAGNIQSAQANLSKLIELQAFSKVTAPFDGVITARNIDTGSLISSSGTPVSGGGSSNAGSGVAGDATGGNPATGSTIGDGASSGSSSTAGSGSLFSIAKLDQLRVYVNVPQEDVDAIRIGQPAEITVSQLPGRIFRGIVKRTSEALDPVSRTLITEIRLPNSTRLLRPGMFANVQIRIPNNPGTLLIPDASMIANANGTQVALIQRNSKIHFQPVTLGRDFGQVIEVTSGLSAGQELVGTPGDGLYEGELVQVSGAATEVQLSKQ